MSCGARGGMSVASNLIPEQVVRMTALANKNDFQLASETHHAYHALFQDLVVEPNPVPIKFLMKRLGFLESDVVRLPLSPLSAENQNRLLQLATDLGLA